MPRFLAFCRAGGHRHHAFFQVHACPGQLEHFTLPHAGVQREQHGRLQVVHEGDDAQISARVMAAFNAPFIAALAAFLLGGLACIQGGAQPGFFIRCEVADDPAVVILFEALDDG
jgi:hypothetical protein